MPASEQFRSLPKVDRVLQETVLREPLARYPRDIVVTLVQEEVESLRAGIAAAAAGTPPSRETAQRQVAERVRARLETLLRPSLRPVINATGVVLHTNLGRALLCDAAADAVAGVARRYVNLEVDLETGERSSRQAHVEELLCRLSGAEAALAVNNNAAALLLAVDTLGQAGVVVSRGEQVEIGDSFRLPDILRKSGVPIHEVGTTNRTAPADYQSAAVPGCVLLKVHRSNFTLHGFTRETTLAELVEVARESGATVVYDLGSGCLESLDAHGLHGEPDVRSALRAGAHVVTMSGDKLLGGPQAGILAGTAVSIAAMRRNPWARALRIDKLTLAALQATLLSYAHDGARDVPTRRLILSEPATIRQRAERLHDRLRASLALDLEVAPGEGSVGGGSFADLQLPSFEVRLRPRRVRATELLALLRRGTPAVLARIKDDCIALDARCVADDEVEPLAAAVLSAVAAAGEGA
jgi:L-seryl-tRNA(Ser) seleniumtransferase